MHYNTSSSYNIHNVSRSHLACMYERVDWLVPCTGLYNVQVQGVMKSNIQSVIERGEKVDQLEETSSGWIMCVCPCACKCVWFVSFCECILYPI